MMDEITEGTEWESQEESCEIVLTPNIASIDGEQGQSPCARTALSASSPLTFRYLAST